MPEPSPAEPVSKLRHVPIRENGEPMVNFLDFCPKVVFDRPRFHYRRETYLRVGAAERLNRAAELIKRPFRLAILEGWRPPHIQRRMYQAIWAQFKMRHPDWSEVQLKRVVNRFSAPLDRRVPPPHMTGGAVDVYLLDETARPADMMSPFERHESKAFPLNAPGLSDVAQKNREVLSQAMIGAGLTNYPSEFWHYSYGDQGWAYRGGLEAALYGEIAPQNWIPNAEDDIEAPLEFIEYEDM